MYSACQLMQRPRQTASAARTLLPCVLLALATSLVQQVACQPGQSPLPVLYADGQSTMIVIGPYLVPGDFDGYPGGNMPLALTTYRLYGQMMLPFTAQMNETIMNLWTSLFAQVKCPVTMTIAPSESAPVTTASSPTESCPSAVAAAPTPPLNGTGGINLDDYDSIDLVVHIYWNANTTLIRPGGTIEATYNQVHQQRLAEVGIQANALTLSEVLAPQAASIMSRLPIPTLTSYTVAVQLTGVNLVPFDVRKQTLVVSLFRQQLVSLAAVSFVYIANASQTMLPSGSCAPTDANHTYGLVNLTMVASNKQANTLDLSAAFQVLLGEQRVFPTAMQAAGLPVAATLLSIAPLPGESITDTINANIPHPPAPAPAPNATAAAAGSKRHQASIGVVAGASVAAAFIALLVLAAGMCLLARRKQRRQADIGKKTASSVFAGVADMPFDMPATDLEKAVPLAQPVGKDGYPALTDFQKLAIYTGVPGMSVLLNDTSANNSGISSRSQPHSGAASSHSTDETGSDLMDHPAGAYVHWDIRSRDIELCHRPDGSEWVLGEGNFGKVLRAVRGGVHDVAVKVLTQVDDEQLQSFRKEISILKSLNFNRNIVQFYGACLFRGQPMLVQEYMEGGDLRKALAGQRGWELRWYHKGQLIALDVARGLHFLHSNKVMHSDLKTGNVLLAKDFACAKIGDVGLARVMSTGYFTNAQLGGTFQYAAPELLLNHKCSEKVDIYSFGVVLWEMVTGEAPQRGQLRDLKVPDECPASIEQLMTECLEVDPRKRPSAKDLFYRIRDSLCDGPATCFARRVSSLPDAVTDDDLGIAVSPACTTTGSSRPRPSPFTSAAGSSHARSSDWEAQGPSPFESVASGDPSTSDLQSPQSSLQLAEIGETGGRLDPRVSPFERAASANAEDSDAEQASGSGSGRSNCWQGQLG